MAIDYTIDWKQKQLDAEAAGDYAAAAQAERNHNQKIDDQHLGGVHVEVELLDGSRRAEVFGDPAQPNGRGRGG